MRRRTIEAMLGARIRARRLARGWSQAKLAEAVDLTPNYIGTLERGEALPTVQTLVLLAKALGASPNELLGDARGDDEWLDKLMAVAETIAPENRALALALVHAVATTPRTGPSTGASQRAKSPKTRSASR